MTTPVEPDFADIAQAVAHRFMYNLLGRRWVWPAITTTERKRLPYGQNFILLDGRPVIEIVSVSAIGAPDLVFDGPFLVESGHRLTLSEHPLYHGVYCSCHSSLDVEVTYKYGSPPPPEVEYAIQTLAEELILAHDGPNGNNESACRLPDELTSISRQGLSMSFDIGAYLKDGQTGVEEIDRVIRLHNPTAARRPARAYSRINPPPRRRNTTQAEE